MNRPRLAWSLLVLIVLLIGAERSDAAKYASDPYSLGAGSRGLAMGGAVIAGPFDATAGYWNPAGMHLVGRRELVAMHSETFGSLLNHDVISFVDARPRTSGRIKSWGAYLYYLGGGGIKITELNQFDRPIVVREESHADLILGASLSGEIKNVSVGATAKLIYKDIGTESGMGLSLDAGAIYQLTPWVAAALVVSDLTTGVIRYGGGSTVYVTDDSTVETKSTVETIYPAVKPGVMFERRFNQFVTRLAASGEIRFESLKTASQFWSGSLSLDTHYGAEIGWRDLVFGRAGFDIGRFTAGAGVSYKSIAVDLAYLHHDDLDNSYRVSAGFRF